MRPEKENTADASKKISYYIGIDPSISNTGVVVLNKKGELLGFFDSKTVKCAKDKHGCIYEYDTKSKAVVDFLNPYSTDNVVAYENYSFGSTHRAYSLAEFGGILKNSLRSITNRAIMYVSPTEVKKFACGYGSATKEIMQKYAKEDEPLLKDASEDICDAYFIAKFAWYEYNSPAAVRYDTNRQLIRNRLEVTNKWKGS